MASVNVTLIEAKRPLDFVRPHVRPIQVTVCLPFDVHFVLCFGDLRNSQPNLQASIFNGILRTQVRNVVKLGNLGDFSFEPIVQEIYISHSSRDTSHSSRDTFHSLGDTSQ